MGYVLPGHTMGGVVQQQLTAGKQNYTSKGSLMDDETFFLFNVHRPINSERLAW